MHRGGPCPSVSLAAGCLSPNAKRRSPPDLEVTHRCPSYAFRGHVLFLWLPVLPTPTTKVFVLVRFGSETGHLYLAANRTFLLCIDRSRPRRWSLPVYCPPCSTSRWLLLRSIDGVPDGVVLHYGEIPDRDRTWSSWRGAGCPPNIWNEAQQALRRGLTTFNEIGASNEDIF